jgi:hypothetical protein
VSSLDAALLQQGKPALWTVEDAPRRVRGTVTLAQGRGAPSAGRARRAARWRNSRPFRLDGVGRATIGQGRLDGCEGFRGD